MDKTEQAKVTIVITPRDRFGIALESFRSVIAYTGRPYDLVYVDAGGPADLARDLKKICLDNGFVYIRHPAILKPNEARNIGVRAARTPYIAFLNNDVVVSPGWLSTLVASAEETGAEVVAPLTCQKMPLHREIHQAGGLFADDVKSFLAARPEDRRLKEVELLQGKKVHEVTLTRGETQCCEFHCALVRRDVFARIGQLDELLATKEHIDFCLSVWQAGGRVMFEPAAVVTFLGHAGAIEPRDLKFFALRWSPAWQRSSLAHFQRKWGLPNDPYFAKRKSMLRWRHYESIVEPLLRKAPLIGHRHKWLAVGSKVALPALEWWSTRLASRHAQDSANTRPF
ncbi:MAG TPA: glycosyltransferase [Rhizobiaceae bacterium]|nr:glycosyltransferase [Rhizobiaceae bacterium]